MKRLLLVVPTTSYRTEDFVAAAGRLGVELVVASDRPSTFQEAYPDDLLTLDFSDPPRAARAVAEGARRRPLDAVVPVDDRTAVVGAAIAEALGLRTSAVEAVARARDKHAMRVTLRAAGLPGPRFRLLSLDADPVRAAREMSFPCVLKPTGLSASRGVIRADRPDEFVAAFRRIAALLRDPEVAATAEGTDHLLVEGFIPGREVALEGLLIAGRLQVLALFDKPDPLDGPFFEETLYVTPSRLPAPVQAAIVEAAGRAAAALGLREGPVHAELRVNEEGPWLLELAPRSIGGLCSRTLRFGTGLSLEELILRHALGLDVASLTREARPAGVMMLPIPRAGVLLGVDGLSEAEAVPGVEAVTVTAHVGQPLVPLPEGSRYLGFAFARADTPEAVEAALREAQARLRFRIGSPAPATGAGPAGPVDAGQPTASGRGGS